MLASVAMSPFRTVVRFPRDYNRWRWLGEIVEPATHAYVSTEHQAAAKCQTGRLTGWMRERPKKSTSSLQGCCAGMVEF